MLDICEPYILNETNMNNYLKYKITTPIKTASISKENENEHNLENYQKSEVSKLEWKTIDECLESIRPYSLEKKQLITNINKVLQEYRLYS
jgi:hypothetical protein